MEKGYGFWLLTADIYPWENFPRFKLVPVNSLYRMNLFVLWVLYTNYAVTT